MLNNRILKRAAAVVCSAAILLPFSGTFTNTRTHALSASTAVSEEIGLVGNLFCVADNSAADHAALQWATTLPADSYTLYRSTSPDDGFIPVYEGSGTSYEDDDMQTGSNYYYQLKVTSKGKDSYSSVKSLIPCALPSGLSTYDNQKGSSLVYEASGYKVGSTYEKATSQQINRLIGRQLIHRPIS